MRDVITRSKDYSFCNKFVCFLAFCWLLSIICGAVFATYFRCFSTSLMRTVIVERVSIVGIIVILFLPLFLSVIAMHFYMPWIFYVVCALKGFCYGFVTYLLLILYLDSAWLVSCFAIFSAHTGSIPLFLLWIRFMNDSAGRWKYDVFVYTVWITLIGFLDYFIISPFLITLMR